MSVADHEIDDPADRDVCEDHGVYTPCTLCWFQRELERWESEQEER